MLIIGLFFFSSTFALSPARTNAIEKGQEILNKYQKNISSKAFLSEDDKIQLAEDIFNWKIKTNLSEEELADLNDYIFFSNLPPEVWPIDMRQYNFSIKTAPIPTSEELDKIVEQKQQEERLKKKRTRRAIKSMGNTPLWQVGRCSLC